jgi:DnaJ-class molecular chaperone
MRRPKAIKTNPNESVCPACNGNGVPAFKTTTPGRRVYQPECAECHGIGRINKSPWLKAERIKKADQENE